MKFLKIQILLVVFLSLTACSSKKNNSTKMKEEVILQNETYNKKRLAEGYVKASIIFSENKKAPCDYLIQIDESKILLEPIAIKDFFKTSDLAVWVKYHPLRRMSTCGNTQPVEIIAIDEVK